MLIKKHTRYTENQMWQIIGKNVVNTTTRDQRYYILSATDEGSIF